MVVGGIENFLQHVEAESYLTQKHGQIKPKADVPCICQSKFLDFWWAHGSLRLFCSTRPVVTIQRALHFLDSGAYINYLKHGCWWYRKFFTTLWSWAHQKPRNFEGHMGRQLLAWFDHVFASSTTQLQSAVKNFLYHQQPCFKLLMYAS